MDHPFRLNKTAPETNWLKRPILVLTVMLMASMLLGTQVETGSIEGFVSDESGHLAAASVELRNLSTREVRHTVSDSIGYYKFENIQAGQYTLWLQAPDHDSVWIMRLPVEHGQSVHQDIFLARSHAEARASDKCLR